MSAGLLIPLSCLLDDLARTAGSIYVDRHRGRCKWVTRIGPNGLRGRDLYVDVDAAIEAHVQCGKLGVVRQLRRRANEWEGASR